jgi:hypothetical protein
MREAVLTTLILNGTHLYILELAPQHLPPFHAKSRTILATLNTPNTPSPRQLLGVTKPGIMDQPNL